jgi:hypothetical protein
MPKNITQKLNDFRANLNKPTKIIITLVCVGAVASANTPSYPPLGKSLSVLIPVIVLFWVWGAPKKQKPTSGKKGE